MDATSRFMFYYPLGMHQLEILSAPKSHLFIYVFSALRWKKRKIHPFSKKKYRKKGSQFQLFGGPVYATSQNVWRMIKIWYTKSHHPDSCVVCDVSIMHSSLKIIKQLGFQDVINVQNMVRLLQLCDTQRARRAPCSSWKSLLFSGLWSVRGRHQQNSTWIIDTRQTHH